MTPLPDIASLSNLDIRANETLDCAEQSANIRALQRLIVDTNRGRFDHDCE